MKLSPIFSLSKILPRPFINSSPLGCSLRRIPFPQHSEEQFAL